MPPNEGLGDVVCEELVGHGYLASLLGESPFAARKGSIFWMGLFKRFCEGSAWARRNGLRVSLLPLLDYFTNNFTPQFSILAQQVAEYDGISKNPNSRAPPTQSTSAIPGFDDYCELQVGQEDEGEGDDNMGSHSDQSNRTPEQPSYFGPLSDVDNGNCTKEYSGEESGKSKGKGVSLKRSSGLMSSGSQGGSGNQGEDDSSNQRNKRSQNNKQNQGRASQNNQRSLACPYYKNNPIEYPSCAEWHDPKLAAVKEHCKNDHSKSLLCGRCKKFRARSFDRITQHLEDDDCEKSKFPGPPEENTSRTSTDFSKAKTWEKVYENLFPLKIPSPFWEDPIEVLTGPIDSPKKYATGSRECRVGLAKFLSNYLGVGQEDIESLLSEYDTNWMSKSHDQSLLLANLSGSSSGVGRDIAGYRSIEQSSAQELGQGLIAPPYDFGLDFLLGSSGFGG